MKKRAVACKLTEIEAEDLAIIAEDLDVKAGQLTRKIISDWLRSQDPIDPERRRSHRERQERRTKAVERMGLNTISRQSKGLRTIPAQRRLTRSGAANLRSAA